MLFSILLSVHSWLRWLVLLLGLFASIRAFHGWFTYREWTRKDYRILITFIATLDTQFLVGCFLYLVSPLTPGSLGAIGAAMRHPVLRFFTIEHSTAMLVGTAIAHIGSMLARRPIEDFRKHKRWALGLLFCLLVIMAAIPWPIFQHGSGRPLFRF